MADGLSCVGDTRLSEISECTSAECESKDAQHTPFGDYITSCIHNWSSLETHHSLALHSISHTMEKPLLPPTMRKPLIRTLLDQQKDAEYAPDTWAHLPFEYPHLFDAYSKPTGAISFAMRQQVLRRCDNERDLDQYLSHLFNLNEWAEAGMNIGKAFHLKKIKVDSMTDFDDCLIHQTLLQLKAEKNQKPMSVCTAIWRPMRLR